MSGVIPRFRGGEGVGRRGSGGGRKRRGKGRKRELERGEGRKGRKMST